MARVLIIEEPGDRPDLETLRPERMINFSVRMMRSWVRLMKKESKKMSETTMRYISPADLMREAVFQYWIKRWTNDERATILPQKYNGT